eukprot:365130-Chlamydomonas_euryale.AAC.3
MLACEPGANAWVEKTFHDCVYDIRDTAGFVLGLVSILFWVFAQLPQVISNMKNQTAEALSPWFLAQWFLGDTLNLLGCLVQGEQLPTTTYLAMYFVLSDVIMLMQVCMLHHRHMATEPVTSACVSSMTFDANKCAYFLPWSCMRKHACWTKC